MLLVQQHLAQTCVLKGTPFASYARGVITWRPLLDNCPHNGSESFLIKQLQPANAFLSSTVFCSSNQVCLHWVCLTTSAMALLTSVSKCVRVFSVYFVMQTPERSSVQPSFSSLLVCTTSCESHDIQQSRLFAEPFHFEQVFVGTRLSLLSCSVVLTNSELLFQKPCSLSTSVQLQFVLAQSGPALAAGRVKTAPCC